MHHRKHLIGVISDTHGWVDPTVAGHFKGVDHILHAGDIGNLAVLSQLKGIAPMTAVRGNIDEGIGSTALNVEENFSLFGIAFFMIHILGNPERLPQSLRMKVNQLAPAVVIFGHTHQSYLRKLGGVLYLNPGSAGPKRFSLPRSIGLLAVADGEVEANIIMI